VLNSHELGEIELMRDFQCFLLNEQFTGITDLKDLETLLIKDDFIKLKQKKPAPGNKITCFIKKQNIENHDSLEDLFFIDETIINRYMLLFTVFTDDRIFIISDSHFIRFIKTDFIQWDFSLRIGINASFIKQMENKISLPFHADYIFSLDENLSEKNLKAKFKKQNYLTFKGNIEYAEIINNCSLLYSVYASDICKSHLFYYKKINYMDDHQISAQFIKTLGKSLFNKNRNNILISYPSPDIFDFDGYYFINGQTEKKYSDVGINELCDFLELIDKKEDEWDLNKIEISPINGNKEKMGNHSLLDLIIFEFEYRTDKYVYNNNSIYMISKNVDSL
jgi:hypothetical protein